MDNLATIETILINIFFFNNNIFISSSYLIKLFFFLLLLFFIIITTAAAAAVHRCSAKNNSDNKHFFPRMVIDNLRRHQGLSPLLLKFEPNGMGKKDRRKKKNAGSTKDRKEADEKKAVQAIGQKTEPQGLLD